MEKKHKDKIDGVRGKIFINYQGETLICHGRLKFLETLDACGSIQETANKLGMSYRKAWSLVEATNKAAGICIIDKLKGRPGRGGAKLTVEGHKLIKLFRLYIKQQQNLMARLTRKFEKEFLR